MLHILSSVRLNVFGRGNDYDSLLPINLGVCAEMVMSVMSWIGFLPNEVLSIELQFTFGRVLVEETLACFS